VRTTEGYFPQVVAITGVVLALLPLLGTATTGALLVVAELWRPAADAGASDEDDTVLHGATGICRAQSKLTKTGKWVA